MGPVSAHGGLTFAKWLQKPTPNSKGSLLQPISKFLEKRQPLAAIGIVKLVKKEVMRRTVRSEKIHVGRRSGMDRWVKQSTEP